MNKITSKSNNASFGWLHQAITALGTARRHVAIVGNGAGTALVSQAYPLQLLYDNPVQLLEALKIATQGAAQKVTAAATVASTPVDIDLDLSAARSCGARIRITDSLLNFKRGTYKLQLLNGSTVLSEVIVLPEDVPSDIVMLGIQSAGGQATCPGIAAMHVKLIVAESSVTPGSTYIFAESLNMRDLGDLQ